jgi:hypothetical protein
MIRILRILEYIGDRDQIEKTLSHGGVPANGEKHVKGMVIRSRLLGDFAEELPEGDKHVTPD